MNEPRAEIHCRAAPDRIADEPDLHCPRCGYNLHGLPQPRCPECGLEFSWEELIRIAADQSGSGVFEYEWRRRPVRAVLVTLARTALPWRFWPRMPLALAPRVGPLLALAAAALLVRLLLVPLSFTATNWLVETRLRLRPTPLEDLRIATRMQLSDAAGLLPFGVVAWLAAQIFRRSLGRARVRQAQLVRVFVYTFAGMVVTRTILALLIAPAWTLVWLRWRWGPYDLAVAIEELAGLASFVLSLSLAWWLYLRVKRGWLAGPLVIGLASVFQLAGMFAIEFYGLADNRVAEMAGNILGVAWYHLAGRAYDAFLWIALRLG